MSIDDQIAEKKTCSQRIVEAFNNRNEYLEEIMEAINNEESYDGYEDANDALNEFPLAISVDKITQIKIELSWGGPADYIVVHIYDDGEIKSARYHFADWFDHAECTIPEDTAMYDYVINIVDSYR